jgi:xylan 1,4-beta-xylosidase
VNRHRLTFAALLLASVTGLAGPGDPPGPAVTIVVDASRPGEPLRPAWRFFGHDEPNYTYMREGKELLSRLSALCPEPVLVRTHNLLTSGDGTPALKWGSTGAYSEDERGLPRYDWTILDRIFDTYRERGITPYVQIGFMPQALSTRPEPYQHHWTPERGGELATGWAYPPKDYKRWGELVERWVRHSVERYGRAEVERWYWEVWNEPNIFYWRGTPEEYHKLYDHAATAVKRALPTARVGGPEVAGTRTREAAKFLRDFLEHCVRGTNDATGRPGVPLDFVSFHAKGWPRIESGHVRMGIATQLQDIDRGFEVVASFPELRHLPIVIGESDPDGCAACPSTVFPQNGYRNGTLYASYTAASYARTLDLAARRGVNLEGVLTWAFEFEDQPYFAGFRVLSTRGIALPVLNTFRMLGLMGGRRLPVESSADLGVESIRLHGVRRAADVAALAGLLQRAASVLVWHYHDDDLPAADARVELSIKGLPPERGPVLVQHYRIDGEHGNAYEAWKRMGSPQEPDPVQLGALRRASRLETLGSSEWARVEAGTLTLRFPLPRQAVSLVTLRW